MAIRRQEEGMRERRLRWSDYAILAAVCAVVFGCSLVGRRYLTMHEAVLPQSAREMHAAGEWIAPLSAGRPWLERPPLPQWMVVASATIAGRFDREWVVRLPSTCMAMLAVFLVASTAAVWYERTIGLLSGLCLATMFEFTRYAWLAEQDIYLCAIVTASVAVFVRIEFGGRADGPKDSHEPAARGELARLDDVRFFGNRSRLVWLWFALLGAANLAKGLFFGSAMAVLPVAAFLTLQGSWRRIRTFVWLWGWLLALAVAAAWPVAAWMRYPDVVELWKYDLLGRLTGRYTAINEPVWYYWVNLPVLTLPWTLFWAAALGVTARRAAFEKESAERFLWCWALVPLAVFTVPGGKHHHYMLPCLAPWAVLSAVGLVAARNWSLQWPAAWKSPVLGVLAAGLPAAAAIAWLAPKLNGPPWIPAAAIVAVVVLSSLTRLFHHERAAVAAATLFVAVSSLYVASFLYTGAYMDECRTDTEFFLEVARRSETDPRPVIVNADLDAMDVFRILFYSGSKTVPVHNLTFLRDRRFQDPSVLVLSRSGDLQSLERLGRVRRIACSAGSRRESSPADRFALFELEFHRDLARFDGKRRVSPMQAMNREEGPYLGEPIPSLGMRKQWDAERLLR
jgi:4-amino-4-deoxy-L-arabinose transferase-like glycosyltransferase